MWPEVQYQSPVVEFDAGEGLLEAEQQRLVAGVEIGGAELGIDREGQARRRA